MKHHADKKRSEKEFQVNDMVYLKLQPYIQSSIAQRGNHKLSYRFFGPYRIMQRVGTVAYRLDLPPDAKIHPVVHVSQLKQHIPPSAISDTDISQIPDDPVQMVYPEVQKHKAADKRIFIALSDPGTMV